MLGLGKMRDRDYGGKPAGSAEAMMGRFSDKKSKRRSPESTSEVHTCVCVCVCVYVRREGGSYLPKSTSGRTWSEPADTLPAALGSCHHRKRNT